VTDPLVELVLEEPVERVQQFADALQDGSITLTASRARLSFIFAHGARSLERMSAVLKLWREEGGSEVLLARAVIGQLQVRRAVENRGPRCELVWTGDTATGSGVRSTFPVVKEMLSLARRSVLVVTYALWAGTDAGEVIDLLARLSSRGVDVTFALDSRYQRGWNISQLRKHWPVGRRPPTIYTWQHDDDPIAKLHAKVLIVDQRDLLITSANLTGHGLKHNLEFGVRVLGRPAEEASSHLEKLLRTSVFSVEKWIA
jgi:hypothetical protein